MSDKDYHPVEVNKVMSDAELAELKALLDGWRKYAEEVPSATVVKIVTPLISHIRKLEAQNAERVKSWKENEAADAAIMDELLLTIIAKEAIIAELKSGKGWHDLKEKYIVLSDDWIEQEAQLKAKSAIIAEMKLHAETVLALEKRVLPATILAIIAKGKVCVTCGGDGLVQSYHGQYPDGYADQDDCPDCPPKCPKCGGSEFGQVSGKCLTCNPPPSFADVKGIHNKGDVCGICNDTGFDTHGQVCYRCACSMESE